MPIFPIHDGRPLGHVTRPYATWALLAINIAAYFLFEGGFDGSPDPETVYGYGLIPAVFNGTIALPESIAVLPSWLTIITYAFLHSDFWHLLGNMVFLWVFADNVEDAFGHLRFVIFYLLCAAGAGYVFVLSDSQSVMPVIGASGAISGVVAAYLMLHPRQKVWVLVLARIPIRLPAYLILGFWVLFQFYSAFASMPGESVAWWAHIGGLVTGAVLVLVMRRRGVPLFDRAPEAPQTALPPWGEVDDDLTRR